MDAPRYTSRLVGRFLGRASLGIRAIPLSTHILFALLLAGCTGCTTVHNFRGSTVNLKGDGERIPGTDSKMSVTGSGSAPSGDRYIAFRLRGQNCWLVLFHPPVKSGGFLRATTCTGDAAAWLVRRKKPDCAALAHKGRDAPFLTERAERLDGSVELVWRAVTDFDMSVDLCGQTGETAVHGRLEAYTALWEPLFLPAVLLGLGGGPRVPVQSYDKVEENR